MNCMAGKDSPATPGNSQDRVYVLQHDAVSQCSSNAESIKPRRLNNTYHHPHSRTGGRAACAVPPSPPDPELDRFIGRALSSLNW